MTWPILTRLGHKYRLTIPFMSYDQIGVKGHVGVTGVKKVIFTKKSFKSNRLRSVITWLMYMIDLDPLYKSYGSRKSSGVIWGHWGQKFIFPKNAITHPCPCYIACSTYAIRGQKVIHVDQLEMLYLCYGVKCQSGVIWGHRGQNIVFAQNNVQNASPPTDYVAWSRDSCTWISITPSQKVMVLKNHKGSIGVTEVKTLFLHKTF